MATATAKTSRARTPKAEEEQKRLDALKDDSRKVGPNGGSMKRESSAPKKPRESAFVAAEKVLRDADGPMSVDAWTTFWPR